MKNNFALVLIGLLFCGSLYAQRGLGTTDPNPQAALDIESPDKGLLIPRISLTGTSTFAPISGTVSSSHNGLIVYNINPVLTNGLTGEGFYVWQGGDQGNWNRLMTLQDATVSGTVTNSTLRWDGTAWVENAALQSDGTASSTATLFIDGTNSRVGVGTITPTVPFQVIGEGDFNAVYITDSSSVSNTVSAAVTTVIDDLDWAIDSINGYWYLNRLSDNSTLRSGTNQLVINDDGEMGIGTNSPEGALDINSTNNGVLLPRISLSNSSIYGLTGTGNATKQGMLIFNTNTNTNTLATGLDGQGYYYWDSNAWVKIGSGSSSGGGVIDTDKDTQITAEDNDGAATLDDHLKFDVIGNEAMRITSAGNVGIATNTPASTLTVSGTLSVSDTATMSSDFYVQGASITNGSLTANSTTTLNGALVDSLGEAGTLNQILTSTGTSTVWADNYAQVAGTSPNSTLRWDGSAWVESTTLMQSDSSTATLAANTTVTGTLEVSETATLSSDLTIAGNTTASGTLTANSTATFNGALVDSLGEAGTLNQILSSTGTSTAWIDNYAQAAGTNPNSTLRWDGSAWLESTTLMQSDTGTATLAANTTVTGTLEVSETATLSSDLTVAGNTTASGTLTANSTTTLNGALVDASGSPGTAGYVLSSTSTSTEWIVNLTPPTGTVTNSTLRWDGTNWVENAALQSDGSASSTATLFIDATNSRVGVGTITPTVPFQVIGEGDFNAVYITDSSSVSNTVSAAVTTVIDDLDWAIDSTNNYWYLNRLSDNSTLRSGSNQFVITDSGYLGLGTATPDDQLEVTGSAQFAGVVKDASGSSGTVGQVLSSTSTGIQWIAAPVSNTDSQTIAFGSSATTTQTTLDITDGNSLTLQASGSLSFTQNGTNTLELAVTQTDATKIIDADGDTQIQVEEGSDDDTIRFDIAGTETANFRGVTTLLNTDLTINGDTAGSPGNQLTINNTDFSGTTTGARLSVGFSAFTGNTAVATIEAHTNGGVVNNHISLNPSSGNVGIGELAPTDKLHVAGDLRLTGAFKDASNQAGTTGQVLSSTGTSTQWISAIANTDSQTLAFGNSATATQTTLDITDGNSLTLQASGSLSFTQTGTNTLELAVTQTDATKIIDADGDTQIQVEEGSDDDTIRLDANNIEVASFTSTQTQINTAATLGDTLEVTGNATLTADLVVVENTTASGTLTANSTTTLKGALVDASGSAGTAGYVLSSTSTSTEWIVNLTPPTGTVTNSTLRWDGTNWVENAALQSDGSASSTATLFIDATNSRVGVGTITPTVPFQVIGEGDFNAVYITDSSSVSNTVSAAVTTVIDDLDWAIDSTNNYWYLNRLSDNSTLRSGSNQFVITDSGYLGLGTATPDDQLEVTGSAQFAGVVKDASGSSGTVGQVLSSTSTGIQWIAAPVSNTDSQTIAFGSSATTTQTTLDITDGNSLTLQASGSLSFTQTGTNTLELAVTQTDATKIIDGDSDTQIQLEEGSDDDTIRFDTAGSERMIIQANGDINLASNTLFIDESGSHVGIGTITPGQTLTVSGTAQVTGILYDSSGDAGTKGQVLSSTSTQTDWISFSTNSLVDDDGDTQIQLEEGSDDDTIRFDTGGTQRMLISNTGNVGIGVTSVNASATLEVNGDIYATNMHLTSDARYKTNIQDLTQALETVLQLRGVKHDWVQTTVNGKQFPQETTLGLIAQELEQHLPELVRTDAQGYKTVDYTKLTVLLIEAIKAQQKQIDAQEIRLKRIEKHLGL